MDVKSISREDATRAVWRSFAIDEQSTTPPKNRCHLSRGSFDYLSKELGLSIDKEDFGMEAARFENLAQIVKGVMSDTIPNMSCLYLLQHVIKGLPGECHLPIQKVVDSAVVPKLLQFLSDTKQNVLGMAMTVLGNIILKGNVDNTQVLVDAGIVGKLHFLLSSSSTEATVKKATRLLGQLASKSSSIRDTVLLKSGVLTRLSRQPIRWDSTVMIDTNLKTVQHLLFGDPAPDLDKVPFSMTHLVQLLDSIGEERKLGYACSVLSYLCHTPKHANAMIEAGIFPRLLNLADMRESALETMRSLVRIDDTLIETVIFRNAFPRVVSCMFSPVDEVRKEAVELIRCLLNGTSKQVDKFVAQGCIRALCSGLNLTNIVLAINSSLGLMKVSSLKRYSEST